MNDSTYLSRHVEGLMTPADEHERSISTLLSELGRLSDRFKDDTVMVQGVVQPLASSILGLLDGPTGRLDQVSTDRKVRQMVDAAGGDSNAL